MNSNKIGKSHCRHINTNLKQVNKIIYIFATGKIHASFLCSTPEVKGPHLSAVGKRSYKVITSNEKTVPSIRCVNGGGWICNIFLSATYFSTAYFSGFGPFFVNQGEWWSNQRRKSIQ